MALQKIIKPNSIFRHKVLQCGDVEKLAKKRKSTDETPVYYVTIEDTFDVMKRAHIATGHGGRDRMTNMLSTKYADITARSLELYKSYCIECQLKKKRPTVTGVVVRPLLTSDLNSRGRWNSLICSPCPTMATSGSRCTRTT